MQNAKLTEKLLSPACKLQYIGQGLCPWTPAGHCMPSKLGGTRLNPS